MDRAFEMAYEFEKRTRELLEDDDMRFLWNRYFPWFFAADLLIVAAIVATLVWWWKR
jgi:hypothetical protein